MHEHGVAERILEVVLKHAAPSGPRRITDVHLVVGEFSEISADSIGFHWEQVSRGTLAEGATLHFETAPTQVTCWGCGIRYTVTSMTLVCPSCGLGVDRAALLHDVRLTAIDVATDDGPETAAAPPSGP